jgi:lactoylglutathione lyase
MDLGAFSVCLTVKDIHASKAFYEKLGFIQRSGNIDQKWVVLKNGVVVIGLFQGMFEKNILNFSPGWDQDAKVLEAFTDVREIQKELKKKGMVLKKEADETTSGPAHLVLEDPDGNQIMFDQYV